MIFVPAIFDSRDVLVFVGVVSRGRCLVFLELVVSVELGNLLLLVIVEQLLLLLTCHFRISHLLELLLRLAVLPLLQELLLLMVVVLIGFRIREGHGLHLQVLYILYRHISLLLMLLVHFVFIFSLDIYLFVFLYAVSLELSQLHCAMVKGFLLRDSCSA